MTRFVLGCLLVGVFFGFAVEVYATSYTVDIYAHVPGCGDALIQSGEECDGTNLGGATCESVGFDEGTLNCSNVCTFIAASCTIREDTAGGTRPSGAGNTIPITDTNVVVSGRAVPGMSMALLKDGQRIATVPAKSDGTFQVTVTGLSSGTYTMQVVGTLGFSAVAQSEIFEVRVIKNSTTKISGVLLPPIVVITPKDELTVVAGNTLPSATVRLVVDGVVVGEVVSDETGRYVFSQPANALEGKAVVVSLVTDDELVSSVPLVVEKVVDTEIPRVCTIGIDTNGDCRVDVVDFFVMRWRFLRSLVAEKFDLNEDGTVSIVDFSILAYYWTG